jgi:hypothetical protein
MKCSLKPFKVEKLKNLLALPFFFSVKKTLRLNGSNFRVPWNFLNAATIGASQGKIEM